MQVHRCVCVCVCVCFLCWLAMDKICTPKCCGCLNILHLCSHVIARKATLLLVLVEQKQSWTQMLAHLCSNAVSTPAFGHWQPSYWDVIFGKFEVTIPGCPFTSSLVADWKLITRDLLWHGRDDACGNSLRLESLHWSRVFDRTLVQCSPRQAYFLSQKGIESINDVTDVNGQVLSFGQAALAFGLGMHYRHMWNNIKNLVNSLPSVPPLMMENRICHWHYAGSSILGTKVLHGGGVKSRKCGVRNSL
ncbi:hypothetical protein L7F22_024010 [Adiantum nelumboides]|nr:hypothetical protein [Adiantum nelumboides]